ncbi:DUF5666 domain-containing protein [Acidisphaera sp. L21]|uniref:DUF5666 domain-containing protein n=1 Tax=Acidisphaera sp. L21 TaxID=1641851 RepID=UPI00131C3FD4|nr:DUF5666 domain-containing protein [Acidisphaera sp. L21]
MNRAGWLCLVALVGCSTPSAPPPMPAAVASGPTACRVGPDGARPIADRGIGATGVKTADRGIGGTGAPRLAAPDLQTADRGIGGTGIIGVITGFASVCVAGEEVALPDTTTARIDGKAASVDDLRAGQVVAMEAAGRAGALLAREIVVRHAVIGPVQSNHDGMMIVAGQQVLVGDSAGGGTVAQPGQFVAVSGLRQPGGIILATRIDPAPSGPVLLRGELTLIYGTARVGAQAVMLPAGVNLPSGFPVVVTGVMQGSVLMADSVARDIADESPAAYFGPQVSNFVVEGFVAGAVGGYLINHEFVSGGGYGADTRGRGIARFSRRPEGGLATRGLQMSGGGAGFGGFGRGFAPAPTPGGAGFNRPDGAGRDGVGGGQRGRGNRAGFGPRFSSPDSSGQDNGGPAGGGQTGGQGASGFGGGGYGGGFGGQGPGRR